MTENHSPSKWRILGKNRPDPTRRRLLWFTLSVPLLWLAGCGREEAAPALDDSATIRPRFSTASQAQAAPAPPIHTASQARAAQRPEPTATPAGPLLPDRLVIPRIDLDIPVVELGWSTNSSNSDAIFSEWNVAAHAAGWHKNSALPGADGNIVMSGHNNILGAVFRELDQLRKDDEITVYTGDEIRAYRIERVVIVPEKHATDEQRAENARWIAPTPDERLTLVSCWPRNDNTHRIIVVARPASSG